MNPTTYHENRADRRAAERALRKSSKSKRHTGQHSNHVHIPIVPITPARETVQTFASMVRESDMTLLSDSYYRVAVDDAWSSTPEFSIWNDRDIWETDEERREREAAEALAAAEAAEQARIEAEQVAARKAYIEWWDAYRFAEAHAFDDLLGWEITTAENEEALGANRQDAAALARYVHRM